MKVRKITKKLLTLLIILSWLLTGWPPIWLKPRIPPVKQVYADTEILRPTAYTDSGGNTTNPTNAYDASNGTTFSTTSYASSADPSITFHTWQTTSYSYTNTYLKVRYHADAGTDDTYAIAYSTSGCSGSFTDLVGPTSAGASDTTVSSADLGASSDLSQLCVKIYITKNKGPDNKNVYIRDIWTEGTYTPPPVISVTISDGNVAYGIMAENTSKSTLPGELNDMQTATNNGNTIENFNIKGQDTACPWALASSAGNDQYVHQFCNDTANDCSSPPTNYTALTTSYQTLATSVAVNGGIDFQLRITVPTTTSCYDQQSVNVIIQAVQG